MGLCLRSLSVTDCGEDIVWVSLSLIGATRECYITIILQFSDFVANKISVQSSGHFSLLLGRSGLLFAGEVKPKAARSSLSQGILNTHC